MADILVQNAIADVTQQIRSSSSKINYSAAFGTTLKAVVDSIIRAKPTSGPFTSLATAPTGYICDLSDVQKISRCVANYSGSGYYCDAVSNTGNPWTDGSVLKGTPTVSQSAIATLIKNSNTVLGNIWAESQTQVSSDIYLAYISLRQTYITENNTNILQNWYGVGLNTDLPGSKISSTNVLKVCGTSWKCGEGATCTWTVPAGATKVKFQVWGAGHGSNSACCCGGAPFSETGAYAEMTLCATPGDQYTICAGCSCMRWCCSNETPGCGCMSGVTGPGICCLKADGAGCYTANCNEMNYARCAVGAGSACHKFQNLYCTDSGPCWCNYGEYCFSNSCSTCGVVAAYPACCYTAGCSCATPAKAVKHGPQYTMFGIHGGGCLNTNNYGYHIRPPIIDADTGLEFVGGCRCQTFTSGSCCGGCNASGWTWHPGHGGAGTHMMGGSTDHQGDTGRGGMVQVSWI